MMLQWAYPRGRGGAVACPSCDGDGEGLSPRTRGSHPEARRVSVPAGPIPADAGEPSTSRLSGVPARAYPRGRGGAEHTPELVPLVRGLSPRTRGSRAVAWVKMRFLGPIPADAGEPDGPRANQAARGPIPADAGEPCPSMRRPHPRRAYPRGRGGAAPSDSPACCIVGLSPRTRGSLHCSEVMLAANGPIPADAGEPSIASHARDGCGAYPRGRGGASTPPPSQPSAWGLSPRTRGSR